MISVQHAVKYHLFININTHIEHKKRLINNNNHSCMSNKRKRNNENEASTSYHTTYNALE